MREEWWRQEKRYKLLPPGAIHIHHSCYMRLTILSSPASFLPFSSLSSHIVSRFPFCEQHLRSRFILVRKCGKRNLDNQQIRASILFIETFLRREKSFLDSKKLFVKQNSLEIYILYHKCHSFLYIFYQNQIMRKGIIMKRYARKKNNYIN